MTTRLGSLGAPSPVESTDLSKAYTQNFNQTLFEHLPFSFHDGWLAHCLNRASEEILSAGQLRWQATRWLLPVSLRTGSTVSQSFFLSEQRVWNRHRRADQSGLAHLRSGQSVSVSCPGPAPG